MNSYKKFNNLEVDSSLLDLFDDSFFQTIGKTDSQFWAGFEAIVSQFTERNQKLLDFRDQLQHQIDQWCLAHQNNFNQEQYQSFLKEIGYLEDQVSDFKITTNSIDDEIAKIAGAQLVVPVSNARYALNALNARYGSLYDALYGTNALSELGSNSHQQRSQQVISYAKDFLSQCFELSQGDFHSIKGFAIKNGHLSITLNNGNSSNLKNPNQFLGYIGSEANPSSIILTHHNLHLMIEIDRNHPIGKTDLAAIKDIKIESAISAIIDCEDSVAAVDGADKALVYQNWIGLMRGDLSASFEKNGKLVTREINQPIQYKTAKGKEEQLKTTALLLIRNVGHLTTSNAVLYDGKEVFEGMLDAYLTSAIAMINLKKEQGFKNSKTDSIYIVKPKMHGPKEVGFANDLYSEVEKTLGLKANTIKLGVMDEERRTSVNLKACIEQVKDRVCFINTGFLDRTGDEIHTHMELFAIPPKGDFKSAPWMLSYEKSNVDVGLDCGFFDKAQIGKGMWAKADDMKSMLETKSQQLLDGASCAWVPSPTAASLHAMHYFSHEVKAIQTQLEKRQSTAREEILEVLKLNKTLSKSEIQNEIENNAQGILGYVVRWINHGVGCSKVPDIDGIALMEDRATLRISSQHIANWLNHRIVTKNQVETALKKMAKLVDSQNADDPSYQPMSDDFANSIAFSAAYDLIFKAKLQPNGYTEPLLHQKRRLKKTGD